MHENNNLAKAKINYVKRMKETQKLVLFSISKLTQQHHIIELSVSFEEKS